MIEIDENFSSKNRKLHTKFILLIFLLLYLYCTRNIDCSWKIFLGEKLVIFRRGQMVNDRGEWGGARCEKDQHDDDGGGGRCWWRVVLAKSNLKRGECDPAPP